MDLENSKKGTYTSKEFSQKVEEFKDIITKTTKRKPN